MKLIRAWMVTALLVTGTAWADPLAITPINNNAVYSTTTNALSLAFHIENTGNTTLNWTGFQVSESASGPGVAGCCSFLFAALPFSNPGSLAAGAAIDWTAVIIGGFPAGGFLPIGVYQDILSITFRFDNVVVGSATATAVASVAAVPEPTSLALLLIGLAAFAPLRLRKPT